MNDGQPAREAKETRKVFQAPPGGKRATNSTAREHQTNGLDLLRQDHDEVRELFGEFRTVASEDKAGRMEELCARIFHELEMHTAIDAGDRAFKAKMLVLIENVEHHAKEEEEEMFPQLPSSCPRSDFRAWRTSCGRPRCDTRQRAHSKEELQDRAREADIEGRSSMSKQELVEELQQES